MTCPNCKSTESSPFGNRKVTGEKVRQFRCLSCKYIFLEGQNRVFRQSKHTRLPKPSNETVGVENQPISEPLKDQLSLTVTQSVQREVDALSAQLSRNHAALTVNPLTPLELIDKVSAGEAQIRTHFEDGKFTHYSLESGGRKAEGQTIKELAAAVSGVD